MQTIEATEDLAIMLASERAILFKHSTRCNLSASARRHVEQFVESYPTANVFVINVVEHRSLSGEAESRLGVRHETPQVILLENGQAVRDASHRRVRVKTLASWWNGDAQD
jgi:bacillithiol system protein YtxJ